MSVLNLINQEKSDLKYQIYNFPDGQVHIKFEQGFNKFNNVIIICRICNASDLFLLMQIKDIFDRNFMKIEELDIKYLFTARTDRIFSIGEAFDLKLICDSLKNICSCISILDCHSKVGEDLVGSLQHFAFEKMFNKQQWVCFPDAGAKNRMKGFINGSFIVNQYAQIMNIPQVFNHKKIITCSKVRDSQTNKLSDFGIENIEKIKKQKINNLYVIDDLCDGGGTFIGIATMLQEKLKRLNKLHLFVTHAIQLEGIKKVAEYYNTVTITNSYKDWDKEGLPDNVKVINVCE